jgi:hypothetical protein
MGGSREGHMQPHLGALPRSPHGPYPPPHFSGAHEHVRAQMPLAGGVQVSSAGGVLVGAVVDAVHALREVEREVGEDPEGRGGQHATAHAALALTNQTPDGENILDV